MTAARYRLSSSLLPSPKNMRHLSSTPRTHATIPREVDVFSKGPNPELASWGIRQTLVEKLSCDRSRLKKVASSSRGGGSSLTFRSLSLKRQRARQRCSQPIPVNALCTQEPLHPCPDCARMTWKKSSFGAIWELSSPLSLDSCFRFVCGNLWQTGGGSVLS